MKLLPLDYAVRNLGRAPGRLISSLAGSALVVLLVIASAAFVRGMRQSLALTAGEHNAILLGAGSEESIERSEVPLRAAGIVAASIPGLREQLGERFVSPEIHVGLAVASGPGEAPSRLTVVRGVLPSAFLVHTQVAIREGRAPRTGCGEILVGPRVASQLGLQASDLPVGSRLWIDERPWTVVGLLSAPHSVMEAEIWMPLSDLQVVAQRDDISCVILTLDPARGEFADVQAFAAQRLDLELTALRERAYYRALTEFFAPVRWLVLVTAALIALGGVLGGLNTLYAAFSGRVREVGTLQVMGYSRFAVALSLLQEALLTTTSGALGAACIAIALLDGLAVRFSMGAFGLVVDAPVLATGLAAGVVLGIVGALPPIVRCVRLPLAGALRA